MASEVRDALMIKTYAYPYGLRCNALGRLDLPAESLTMVGAHAVMPLWWLCRPDPQPDLGSPSIAEGLLAQPVSADRLFFSLSTEK